MARAAKNLAESGSLLTDKQLAFCREYIVDLNATQAAIRAGYSESTAGSQGFDLLKKPEIHDEVSRLFQERLERTQVTADWVLRQAVMLHQRCMNEKHVLTDRKGEPILDDDGNLQWVFNAAGAAKALELVGKHVNIQAFRENVNHTGAVTHVTVDASKLTEDQLRALASIPMLDKPAG